MTGWIYQTLESIGERFPIMLGRHQDFSPLIRMSPIWISSLLKVKYWSPRLTQDQIMASWVNWVQVSGQHYPFPFISSSNKLKHVLLRYTLLYIYSSRLPHGGESAQCISGPGCRLMSSRFNIQPLAGSVGLICRTAVSYIIRVVMIHQKLYQNDDTLLSGAEWEPSSPLEIAIFTAISAIFQLVSIVRVGPIAFPHFWVFI